MKILIIEDDYKIATSIKKGLEQEKYIADIAEDGLSGYEMALDGEYAVILLDLMLPELNGIEVCRKLRKEEISTPILMLTAKSELEDKVTGLNIGADDYLTKPFAFEELLARIKALLRRPKKVNSTILKHEDLELDTINYSVKRNGKAIDLSKKEYLVLEYLLRNKGTIITKDQLISKIWEYDSDVLHNTVEQYISYLRNKIDKPFKDKPKIIKTVRGFGYKIE